MAKKSTQGKIVQPQDLNKSILKIAALAVVVLSVIFILSWLSGLSSEIADSNPNTDLPIISPADSSQGKNMDVKLYFAYNDEDLLAPETRTVKAMGDERMEAAALRELIIGPSVSRTELNAVCNSTSVKVVNIEEEGDTLFVTFNVALLSKSLTQYNLSEVNRRTRLMTQAIVNTITGMGRYSFVQLLIDEDGSGTGERVAIKHYGYGVGEAAGDELIAPMSFNRDVVLTPRKAIELLISAAMNDNWQQMYTLTAVAGGNGTVCPKYDVFRTELRDIAKTIDSYQIADFDVSTDGKKTVVWLDVHYLSGGGRVYHRESYPVTLQMENELWRVDYGVLKQLLTMP